MFKPTKALSAEDQEKIKLLRAQILERLQGVTVLALEFQPLVVNALLDQTTDEAKELERELVAGFAHGQPLAVAATVCASRALAHGFILGVLLGETGAARLPKTGTVIPDDSDFPDPQSGSVN